MKVRAHGKIPAYAIPTAPFLVETYGGEFRYESQRAR